MAAAPAAYVTTSCGSQSIFWNEDGSVVIVGGINLTKHQPEIVKASEYYISLFPQ